MKTSHIAIVAVAAVALIIIAAAVVVSNDGDRETLVVETNYDSAPFDYMVGDDLVGIDIDILRAVCDDMGCDLDFRYKTFDSILDSVVAGNCDIGANGFTINDERKERVLFSDSYVTVDQVAVVPVDSDIQSAADIKDRRIAVKNGTTCADCAETMSSDIVYKKTYTEVIGALLAGDAECEFVNSVIAVAQVNEYPGKLKILDDSLGFPSEDFGFVFSKNDADLRDRFNGSLKSIRESGLFGDIMDYYEQNGYSADTPSFFSDSAVTVGAESHVPYCYASDGGFSGIDIDILKAVIERNGMSGVVKTTTFEDIFAGVSDGRIDIGASSITVNDGRQEDYLFSQPYLDVRQVVIAELDANYSAADLKDLTVASQSNTTSLDLARKHTSKVLEFGTYGDAVRAVLDGRADCAVTDSIFAESQITTNPQLKALDILGSSESFAFMFSKENAALRDRVDSALTEMKADGTLEDILDYHCKQGYAETSSYHGSPDVLRVGTFPAVVPFNYIFEGKTVGIDMDLVEAITDQLGLGRCIIDSETFDGVLDGVIDGTYDMGVSEITITEERAERLLYSDPYAEVRQVLVVAADSSFAVSDLPNLTMASQDRTTSMDIAKKHSTKLLGLDTYGDAVDAVIDGRADCAVTDNYVAQSQLSAHPGKLKILDILDSPETFAFVFSKDNRELCDRVNAALADIKRSGLRDDIFGYYEKNDYGIVESYFDSEDVVTIGTFPELPPFDYVFDGKIAGIDMDILRAVNHEMGTSMLVDEPSTFDGVLDGVMSGKYDIGSSGVTVTEERQDRFLFSQPYMQVRQVLIAESGDSYTLDDLGGLTLATHYNTTSLDVAKKYSTDILVFPDYEGAVAAVLDGRADCAVTDNFAAANLLSGRTGLKTLDILDDSEDFAFVFSKDNAALRDRVDRALAALKADGTLDDIFGYYEDSAFAEVESYFDSDRVMKVGTYPLLSPFDYLFDGEPAGIDMDIIQAVAGELDVRVITEAADGFDNVFEGVRTGDYDVGASGITVTDARQQEFLFSTPYVGIKQLILIREGDTDFTAADLADKTVATKYNTTSHAVADKYSDRVVVYQVFDDAVKAVLEGRADCAMIDDFTAGAQMSKHEGLRTLDILDDTEDFAFMFSKEDPELRDAVNGALAALKADGTLDRIFAYYEENGYAEVGSYFDSKD